MAESEPVLWITLAVMLLGLLGTVLPGLPGVSVIFAAAVVYAYLTDFEFVGAAVLILLGFFAALAFLAGILGTTFGARRSGASWAGTLGGIVGGLSGLLAGSVFFGIGAVFGLLAGAAGGVFLGEYLREERRAARNGSTGTGHDWQRTARAAGGVVAGYAVGAVVQVVFGLLSAAAFVLALVY